MHILTQCSRLIFLRIDTTAACVNCGVPGSLLHFSSWVPQNVTHLLLRILRKPCELLCILSACSCLIFLQIDSAAACVYCGVPASLLDFSSWVPPIIRLLLRKLRKPCESLRIFALCCCLIFLKIDSAAACVYCGVPASFLDFLSWLLPIIRLLLRKLRRPCESLRIFALCCYLIFL